MRGALSLTGHSPGIVEMGYHSACEVIPTVEFTEVIKSSEKVEVNK